MTPGARARRSLIFDVVVAALIAALVLSLTAGLGVVAFFALPLLLLGLLWIAVERLVVRLRRRRPRAG
jgi:predicted PurR-regulated permease PerM